MQKISTYITKQQSDKLKQLQESTGINPSESIRRALDEYIKKIYCSNKTQKKESTIKTNKNSKIKIINKTAIPGAPEFYSKMFNIIKALYDQKKLDSSLYRDLLHEVIYIDGYKPGIFLKKIAQEHGIEIPEGLL